ncbi:MAG TPA: polysaccharide pyruvyl transferase family protein [Mycobacteriales bacterium]|nr:polysaccharide pyruvyl transferase family protein [Mycobacteriales bacterium]
MVVTGALPPVPEQRRALEAKVFDAPTRLRIMVVAGATADGVDTAGPLRALRGLGHRVLHVDPAAHPAVLPDGPSSPDLRPLSRALDRFGPHVVVFGGASLLPSARDAADLRRRGILSLGLGFAAAEPPSVTDARARRTDYVTVPARGRGGNILSFRPGVDRDAVVQHLPPTTGTAPEVVFAEDAARADDRLDTAARLAGGFRIGSVGGGFGTRVDGAARLQVLRSAGVHVAFLRDAAGTPALTPALFEGVAAGAVVCVPAGADLAGCFDAGTEVAVSRDGEDLATTIGRLLADPAEADGYRRRAFARLAAEHLYEHRWQSVLSAVLSDLRIGASEHGRRCLERISGAAGRPRTVVVSGWYGARNTGDDLVLESIAQALEAGVPDVDLVVASTNDPATVLADHGLPAVDRRDPYATDDLVTRSTAVVVGGGGIWMDYTFRAAGGVAGTFALSTSSPSNLAVLPLLAGIRRRPVFVHGMGVGPLDDPDARDLVRATGDLCESVTVRDITSAELLRAIPGWSTPVEIAPDVVYGLDVGTPAAPRFDRAGAATVLAVNVRPWGDDREFGTRLAEVLRTVRRERGALLVGVPMMGRDEQRLTALFADITAGDEASDGDAPAPVVLPWTSAPDQLLGDLGACDALVSMRLHGCLLAHRARIPAVGLRYDPKVAEHFAELGREFFAVPLDEIAARLPGVLAAALAERDGLPAGVLAAITRAEDTARESLRRLARSVAAVTPAPPRAETIRHTDPPYARTPGTPGPAPFGLLPAEETGLVDLGQAGVTGGNVADPDRVVRVVDRPADGGRVFHLADRGPAQGDHATLTVEVPGRTPSGDGVRAEILLRVPYTARANRTGRLAWQVLLDGEVVLTEDVAGWDERCTAWVAWAARDEPVRFAVRVLALRDCEEWGWGPAAAVAVRGIRTAAWNGTEPVVAGTSIPRAPSDAGDTPAARPSVWGLRRSGSR